MVAAVVEQKIGAVNRSHLAKELGLTRTYVSLVLNGRRSPSFSVACEMARKMKLTLEDFQGYLEKSAVN